MSPDLLSCLRTESKKFATSEVFDIVVYGSFMKSKEEPNDLDVVIILNNMPLKERLELAQKFKSIIKKLPKTSLLATGNFSLSKSDAASCGALNSDLEIKKIAENPDVRAINLAELFDSNFLARQGIIAEGYSLIHSVSFSSRLGFKGYSLFAYSLKNLNHNEKTKFTYSLIGRGRDGIIKKSKAEPIGKGAILVPIENTYLFEDFLKSWNVQYKLKVSLVA